MTPDFTLFKFILFLLKIIFWVDLFKPVEVNKSRYYSIRKTNDLMDN